MSVKSQIEDLCTKALNFDFISIENESHLHSSSQNAESHFKLIIVSESFKNIPTLKRHKIIYKELDNLMDLIHAVSIHPFDEDEYKKNPFTIDTPDCVNK